MKYKLKEIRLQNGMTQEDVATKSGISRATISKIESGEEVVVQVSTLEALSKVLSCSVSDFLCD